MAACRLIRPANPCLHCARLCRQGIMLHPFGRPFPIRPTFPKVKPSLRKTCLSTSRAGAAASTTKSTSATSAGLPRQSGRRSSDSRCCRATCSLQSGPALNGFCIQTGGWSLVIRRVARAAITGRGLSWMRGMGWCGYIRADASVT